ncbi:MAG: flagellar biosynthesis protein FlhB [Alphaproteobacteria bacterium]|nr:flagellar biosynthesis protein FlhB [Alphaproteobacteria bacterium]
MAEGDDQEQKTEQPTQRRLEEARKRGQIPNSREVGNFLILFVLALTISGFMPGMGRDALHLLTPFLEHPDQMAVDQRGLGLLLSQVMTKAASILVMPLLAAVIAVLAAAFAQNGFLVSLEPVIPKFEKISLMRGLSRMFSMRSLVEFGKGVFKLVIVGGVAYMAVLPGLPHIRRLVDDSMIGILLFLSKLAVKLMIGVCVAMFFIALVDLIYQRISYTRSLRMSKQELKEEYKQQEGDPHVKGRLRQLRMERARKRMMSNVPQADVVITNPTHFAVALKYDGQKMSAPKVVAKAVDFMALTMRKIAEEHQVTIVENPPLARALHDAVEVDEEIPVQHYKAVAEVISYVYRLKGRVPPQMQKRAAL